MSFEVTVAAFGKNIIVLRNSGVTLSFNHVKTTYTFLKNQHCIYRSLFLFLFFRKEVGFIERCWKDVRVGDFVKVVCNEIVPADLLLLYTADPDGVCLIETANLDGESNLKQRRVVPGLCISVSNVTLNPWLLLLFWFFMETVALNMSW